MKKIVSVCLTVFLLIHLCAIALPVFGEGSEDAGGKTVYLSGTGNDANDGNQGAPVATLLAAYKLLGLSGGTVVVSGDATVEGEYRALCDDTNGMMNKMGKVVITSENNAILTVTGEGIWFPGETVIENIRLHFSFEKADTYSYLVANCQKLTIGEGVEVTISENSAGYPIIYGGGFYSFLWIAEDASSDVTVKSGTWTAVYGGGGANGREWGTHIDDVPGDVHVTVTGGTIDTVYGAGNGGVGGTEPVVVFGNVDLNIHGGTVNHVIANGATAWGQVRGNITVTVTGGTIADIAVKSFGDGNTAIEGTTALLCKEEYRTLANGFATVSDLPEEPAEKTVYISDAGNDENNGSAQSPVATLLAAYKLLGTDGGTIVVCGNTTVAGEYRALCEDDNGLMNKVGEVTITSANDAVLTVAGEGIWFPGDTVLENIHLHFTHTAYNAYLVANCRQFTIGEGVEVTLGEGVPGYPIIYGSGFYSFAWIAEGASSDVTVKSGTWAAVYGGGGACGKTWTPPHIDEVPGNVHVTIEGGTIDTVYGAGNGGVGGPDPVSVLGNVELNITGGTITHVVANGATPNAPVKGNITVTITGGTITDITVNTVGDMNFVDGTIQLVCDDSYRELATNFPDPDEEKPNPNPPEEETTNPPETPTDAPETTGSQTPGSSDKPGSTEKPAGTDKAPETQGGCASAVAGSLAVVASLSLAMALISKKKH